MYANALVALTGFVALTAAKVVPAPYAVNNLVARGNETTTITEVVDVYTTYCPQPTTCTIGGKTYTVTEATTLTITDCPCTVVKTCSTCPPVPLPTPTGKTSAAPAPPAPTTAPAPAPAPTTGTEAPVQPTHVPVAGANGNSLDSIILGLAAAAGVLAL